MYMLSKTAGNLYWMARYLERAGQTSRMLSEQFEALEDRSVDDIDRGWRRIYGSIRRVPMGGGLESNFGDEDFMLVDSFVLAEEITLERQNSDSIRSCFSAARENARQTRNVMGKDFWTCLNAAYLALNAKKMEDVWTGDMRKFYQSLEDVVRTLGGIADGTMYRDHGWYFMLIGRFIERTQFVLALLEAQLEIDSGEGAHLESDWFSLLHICEARVAYHRRHSLVYESNRVLGFLISDPLLSNSIRYSLNRIEVALREISRSIEIPDKLEPVLTVAKLLSHIERDWQEMMKLGKGVLEELQELGALCRKLHLEIEAVFLAYGVDSALGRIRG